MLTTLLMAIISTIIIGAIVVIILNLLLSSKNNQEGEDSTSNDVHNDADVTDKKPVEDQTSDLTEEEKLVDQPIFVRELDANNYGDNLKTEEFVAKSIENLKSNNNIANDNEITDNIVSDSPGFTNSKEVIEPISVEVKSDNQIEITEEILKDVVKEAENELIQLENTLDQQISEPFNEPIGISHEIEELKKHDEVKEEEDDFWNVEDTHNLLHLNKSRPKKSKSRPSIKIVFDNDENDRQVEQPSDDSVSKNASDLVEALFDNLDEEVNEYINKSKDETVKGETSVEEAEVVMHEIPIEKRDESYEELAPATGEYKKFDEFSDCFKSETHKREVTRNERQTTSVKTYEITLDGSEQMNEQTINEMLKNMIDKDTKTEVFEESFTKVTQTQSFEMKRDDKIEVLSKRNNESVSHTKTFSERSERSLSSSSLSKMSLEDLDVSLRSSKSRLSETIDNVTKPLRSSPTLFRRSMIEKASEEEYEDNNGIESHKRIQTAIFGTNQSLLMSEMKQKQFRKSLRPTDDLTQDKQVSDL